MTLIISISVIVILLIKNESLTLDKISNKNVFIKNVGLPDLAISTDYTYIRHRSLATSYDMFVDGPEHIELSSASFSISFKKDTND